MTNKTLSVMKMRLNCIHDSFFIFLLLAQYTLICYLSHNAFSTKSSISTSIIMSVRFSALACLPLMLLADFTLELVYANSVVF